MSNGRKYEIPCMYQIKVKGTIPEDWSSWFEGFIITIKKEDETMLNGLVEDQAALHGLLAKIANLGLPLLSVTRLEVPEEYPKIIIDEKESANMKPVIDHATEANMEKFENKSVSLWLEQSFRKLRGKPLLQEDVLEKVVNQLKADENILGILLFGSVALGTHTWKSDIDLIFVLKTHEPASGLANLFVDSIAVQYFFTTLEMLNHNLDTVPYLLYMFSDAKILFDRQGTVTPVIHQLEQYFASHPDVAAEWDRFKQLHQVEKNGPVCAQTTIIQRWDELEEKYSGGSRKRTFFLID